MPSRNDNVAFEFIGAVKDEWQLYSDNLADYTLGRPIGYGASSIVYQAEYHCNESTSTPCALKVLDLDSLSVNSLRLLRRETQLMSLSKHPNVLRVRGTWMEGHKLFIALRLMRSGSVADVMRYAWPGGVEEEVARCVLKQALEGLNYLHINGFIHRDVKAANLLIDDDGTVLLGDLGVAASLNDEESFPVKSTVSTATDVTPRPSPMRSRVGFGKRKSFVGTPCWMAPEVISQKHYDSKADIWSLGITALELAQGRPPGFREPPSKVLMKIIQDEPPTLDRVGGIYKYSRAFQEVIESCLVKDPSKRPTAEELLQTPFFKSAKKKNYLVGALLRDLPPLVDRQERRSIPSALTRLSIDSWDFTRTQTVPLSPKSIHKHEEDGLFEMEETGEPRSNEEPREPSVGVDSASNASSQGRQAEIDDLPGLTDDVSTTSASPQPCSPRPVMVRRTPPPSSAKLSPSPSQSPGLWRKLRGKVSRLSDKDKSKPDSSGKSEKDEVGSNVREGNHLRRSIGKAGANIFS